MFDKEKLYFNLWKNRDLIILYLGPEINYNYCNNKHTFISTIIHFNINDKTSPKDTHDHNRRIL